MRMMAMLATALCALAACGPAPSGGTTSSTGATAAPAAAAASAAAKYAGPSDEQSDTADNFMKTVMQPTAETLWNSVGFVIDASGEHDLAPKNDEEWAAVGYRADALIQVLQGLRNAEFRWDPDNTWNGFIDGVIAAANENKAAADAKSVDAMYEAGERLDKACEACHDHWEKGQEGGP
jgi:hypothetical protein